MGTAGSIITVTIGLERQGLDTFMGRVGLTDEEDNDVEELDEEDKDMVDEEEDDKEEEKEKQKSRKVGVRVKLRTVARKKAEVRREGQSVVLQAQPVKAMTSRSTGGCTSATARRTA